jgi:P4 family phage/plasmid primase-like protien
MNNAQKVKERAQSQWQTIIPHVAGIPADFLDGRHHPCPKCGGDDRFRLIDADAGACYCNQCFSEKNGDGLAAIQWFTGWPFPEALKKVAEFLGLELETSKPTTKRAKNKPDADLEFLEWNDAIVEMWCRAKPGVTAAGISAAGGRLARWKGRTAVVAFPIYESVDKVVGWIIYDQTGAKLKNSRDAGAKMLCTKGSKAGWIGLDGLSRLDRTRLVWKVEGTTDLLALWAAIAKTGSSAAVLSNPFGAGERPKPTQLEKLKGKLVVICHDSDAAGRKGAHRWAKDVSQVADSVKVVEPPGEDADIRDWLRNPGHSYETMELTVKATDGFVDNDAAPARDDPITGRLTEEDETDPSRLAKLFVRSRAGNISCYRDSIYYWSAGLWREIEPSVFRSDATNFVREEFEQINANQLESHGNSDEPPPKMHKIANPLMASVRENIKSYCTIDSRVRWNSTLDRSPGEFKTITDSEPHDRLPLRNGILDLDEIASGGGELYKHTSNWWACHQIPYDYDPTAGFTQRPTWENFLEKNLDGDGERIAVLQEFAGYLLVHNTNEQKFLILEGEGSNGKSVYCAMLCALLGAENVSHVPLELFAQRFALTPTLGKLANIAAECGELDKVAEGFLKSFVGGDNMTFDVKNKSPIDAQPTARLVLATNNRPRFSDRSGGLWRRMILVPFRTQISHEERVPGMDKPGWWTRSGEMPAILNWALDGLARLINHGGFSESSSVNEAMADYRDESNPAREFLEDAYLADPTGASQCHDVYQSYRKWCGANGYRPLGSRMFGREVRRSYPGVRRTKRSDGGLRKWSYQGISPQFDFQVPDEPRETWAEL